MGRRTPSLSWFTPPAADLSAPSLAGEIESRNLSLISHDVPASPARSGPNYLKVFLTLTGFAAFATWISKWTTSDYFLPPQSACDPFAQEGTLYLNMENVSSTVWQPFEKACPPSHLLPLVEFILESDAIDPVKALPWMVNRTVVLIGDSIERFSLDYFCELMEGDLSLIDLTHPYSPPPFRNGRDELREDPEVISKWTADGRPHWCRISDGGLNLNILSFFMYGSATYDEFVQQEAIFRRPHYFAPVQFADRLDHWVQGTLQKAGLKADIVEFSSSLWDVMHWSEVDYAATMSQDVVHAPFPSSERLDWYHGRLTSALDKVEQTFPDANLVWRRGHEVPCGQFHVPCARTAQFKAVADHIIAKRKDRWAVDELGSMIRGHSDFYKDRVHPGPVFRGLWADILLHRLRETYRKVRPPSGRFSPRALM